MIQHLIKHYIRNKLIISFQFISKPTVPMKSEQLQYSASTIAGPSEERIESERETGGTNAANRAFGDVFNHNHVMSF